MWVSQPPATPIPLLHHSLRHAVRPNHAVHEHLFIRGCAMLCGGARHLFRPTRHILNILILYHKGCVVQATHFPIMCDWYPRVFSLSGSKVKFANRPLPSPGFSTLGCKGVILKHFGKSRKKPTKNTYKNGAVPILRLGFAYLLSMGLEIALKRPSGNPNEDHYTFKLASHRLAGVWLTRTDLICIVLTFVMFLAWSHVSLLGNFFLQVH